MKKAFKLLPCLYRNCSSGLQIIRLKRNVHRSFERTLQPGQEFQFQARPGAFLEVGTHQNAWAIVCDRIPCRELIIAP